MDIRFSLASIHVSDLHPLEKRFALDISCLAPHLKLNPVHGIYVNPRRAEKADKEYQKILEAIASLKDSTTSQVTVMFDDLSDVIAISNYDAINDPKAAEWIDLTTPTLSTKKKPYRHFDCTL